MSRNVIVGLTVLVVAVLGWIVIGRLLPGTVLPDAPAPETVAPDATAPEVVAPKPPARGNRVEPVTPEVGEPAAEPANRRRRADARGGAGTRHAGRTG